jgi:D-glycero-beta-D-manno-heptose-7-phosphate kinase
MIQSLLPPLLLDRAQQLIDRFTRITILVLGDVMLDRFLVGRVTRISPEAPVPVVAFDHETCRIGGAGNVAHNVRILGGFAELVGVVGQDPSAQQVTTCCEAAGIRAGLIRDAERPTTTKVRVVTERNQQVTRVDYENDGEIAGEIENGVIEELRRRGDRADVIVISDYLKGTVTKHVMAEALALGRRRHIAVLVDPKIPHLAYYAGATLITPNKQETEIATHRRVRTFDDARDAAREFRGRAQCAGVLMTRGDAGVWLLDDAVEGCLPAAAREVADVTGAGDTVIATLALALASGATSAEAARLANEAAGIVVGKFGPATVSATELLQAIEGSAQA